MNDGGTMDVLRAIAGFGLGMLAYVVLEVAIDLLRRGPRK